MGHQHPTHRVALAVLVGLVPACNSPGGPTPPPTGGESVNTALYDVTVEVFEQTPAGPQPVPSPRGMFQYHRPGDSFTTGNSFTADLNGRHVFPHVLHGTQVKIQARHSSYHQPCAVTSRVTSTSVLKLELVRRGAQPSTVASPVISGMVYRTTPAGREPVVGQAIGYIASCSGLTEAYGWTDDQGRYLFCRVTPGRGCVDTYWGWDSEFGKQVSVNITGDLVVDIDLGN